MKQLKIHIDVIRKSFSLHLSETFAPGITGIFGHSGAGKSTLLQCVSGVNTPTTGRILIDEKPLFCSQKGINVAVEKRKVGYLFQEGRIFPHLTIEKNLKYGFNPKKSQLTFTDVVEMLNIAQLLNHYPSAISGGERQRVALGRALLASPEILLLDEPFSALDQKSRQRIIPYIRKSSKLLDIPILVVSHDLPDLLKLTQRLCIMQNGVVLGHKAYEHLLADGCLQKVLSTSDVINSIELEVKQINTQSQLVTLNGFGANRCINVIMEPHKSNYTIGKYTRVFLKPNDIILSHLPLEKTSFQNQLKGTISQISIDGARVMCMVDCGFTLVCEVSRASAQQMQLKVGAHVFCLFKSLAIDKLEA